MLKRGFTIVELLIVIVVLGVLAAIVTVSYVGISDNAKDAAVQSDLDQSFKKIEKYEIDNGTLPDTSAAVLPTVLVISKSFYSNSGSGNSYIVCRNDTDIAILVRSVTGHTYYISKSRGAGSLHSWPSDTYTTACPAMGISTSSSGFSYKWAHANNAWVSYL